MHLLLAVIGTSLYAGQAWLVDQWSEACGPNAALGPGEIENLNYVPEIPTWDCLGTEFYLKISVDVLWNDVLRLGFVLAVHDVHVQPPLLEAQARTRDEMPEASSTKTTDIKLWNLNRTGVTQ